MQRSSKLPQDLEFVRGLIRSIPDFPSPGIIFRDITPILHDPKALDAAVALHLGAIEDLWYTFEGRLGGLEMAVHFDRIVGIESRGFLFGMALAQVLGIGFFPARKPGKLPAKTIERSYALEYGADKLQIHEDAVSPGDRVLVVDDLLATGGTASAVAEMVASLGGVVVGVLVLIELEALGGRSKLEGLRVDSILKF